MKQLIPLAIMPGMEQQLEEALAAPVQLMNDDRPSLIQTFAEGGVAVLKISGPMVRRKSWYYSSYQVLREDLLFLQANNAISAAVMVFDSPGGEAMGLVETCEVLDQFSKPLVAFVEGYCTSAALRLACHCDQILASADAEVGNIGTRISLDDYSEMNRINGVRRFDFVTGYAKAIGSCGSPVTEQQQAFLQQWVERLQVGFRNSLKSRGLSASQIAAVSTGEWWDAVQAQSLGLVDGVSTLSQVVARLSASPNSFPVKARQERIAMSTATQQAQTIPQAGANVVPFSSLDVPVSPVQQAPAAAAPVQQAAPQQPANTAAPVQRTEPQQVAQESSPAPGAAVTPAPVQQQVAPVSPVAAPAAPQAQQQTEAPATYQQILDACEGVTPTAEFIVSQQQAGATPSQVRRNFIQQLAAASAVQSAPAGVKPGTFQQGSEGSASGSPAGADPISELEQLIDEQVEKGLPRQQAARKVIGENPQLFTAFQKAQREMTPEQREARRARNCGRVLSTSFQQRQ